MSSAQQKPKILVIIGPTASGKSALAVTLAKKFDGEIVSADSRQVYRGMDIGTGKITKKEMGGVAHHLIDVASPRARFTAARYQKLARAAIKKTIARGKLPVVVGGTGLYVDALLYDYHLPEVRPDPALRRVLDAQTPAVLFRKLQKVDPRRAAGIDRHNGRRLARALEIVMTTKQPVPAREMSLARRGDYDTLKIGLKSPMKMLERKIKARLEERMRRGMVREVRALHDANGLSWDKLDAFGLEYRWVSRYLRGALAKKEMMQKLRTEIRRYAKRQMTWFKRDPAIHWIEHPREAARTVKAFLTKE